MNYNIIINPSHYHLFDFLFFRQPAIALTPIKELKHNAIYAYIVKTPNSTIHFLEQV